MDYNKFKVQYFKSNAKFIYFMDAKIKYKTTFMYNDCNEYQCHFLYLSSYYSFNCP